MSDTRDPQALTAAAEQAAAAGDIASAERLLRETAALQEATLGPLHPDLANTLNNLGVVCEIADNPVDAEHYFRRACAIAAAVLEPDHPFVETSRKNLEDFCAARGKPAKLPGAPPSLERQPTQASNTGAAAGKLPLTDVQDRSRAHETTDELSKPDARRTWRPLAVAAAVIAAGLLLTLAATWLRSGDRAEPLADAVTTSDPPMAAASSLRTSPPEAPEAPKDGLVTRPKESVAIQASRPSLESPRASTTARTGGTDRRTAARSALAAPVVAVAQLCRSLSTGAGEWRCVPPDSPVGSGPLFFYTRLKAPAAVTVQHRWYRDGRVRHVVELPIHANMLAGYRTYSRQTVDARAGDWRVELRTSDGTVLHEERFVVR